MSSRRTWCRCACCNRSARPTRRTGSRASASTATSTRPYLPMALGSGSVTPMQMAAAYAVFANGGYRVEPAARHPRHRPPRPGAGRDAAAGARRKRARHSRAQRLRHGHAAQQRGEGRHRHQGLAGAASATTCTARPAPPTIRSTPGSPASSRPMVGIAWIGYDTPRQLGVRGETGGSLSLPVWTGYMHTALQGVPVASRRRARGVVQVDGDVVLRRLRAGARHRAAWARRHGGRCRRPKPLAAPAGRLRCRRPEERNRILDCSGESLVARGQRQRERRQRAAAAARSPARCGRGAARRSPSRRPGRGRCSSSGCAGARANRTSRTPCPARSPGMPRPVVAHGDAGVRARRPASASATSLPGGREVDRVVQQVADRAAQQEGVALDASRCVRGRDDARRTSRAAAAACALAATSSQQRRQRHRLACAPARAASRAR